MTGNHESFSLRTLRGRVPRTLRLTCPTPLYHFYNVWGFMVMALTKTKNHCLSSVVIGGLFYLFLLVGISLHELE